MRGYGAQDDVAIAAIAATQYGLITYDQLTELGIGRGAVDRRVLAGRLHRLHRGVYAVGHAAPRDESRWLAAVLAAGDGAVLSHASAARLWQIRHSCDHELHVTVATRAGRRRPGIVVHRAQLDSADRTTHRGIPVTSPERTVVDLANGLTGRQLQRTIREAEFLGLLDHEALGELLLRRPCRPVRALLDDLAPTQSEMEDRLLRICSRHGIPAPLTQQELLGRRVDALWPDVRVVVEVDGWQGHGGRMAFQADRTATNALQLAGYTVLRFTWADLTRRPAVVARTIATAVRTSGRIPLDP